MCAVNFVKFGHMFLRYTSGQTNIQTEGQTDMMLIAILYTPTWGTVIAYRV